MTSQVISSINDSLISIVMTETRETMWPETSCLNQNRMSCAYRRKKTWLLRLCRIPGYPTETVVTRFHFLVPVTSKRLLKNPTEHLSHTNGSLWFVNKLKETRVKALEVTFADSLSQTCSFCLMYLVCFWVDSHHASIMSWYMCLCLLFAVIELVLVWDTWINFFMCVENGDTSGF